jgi:transposase-like protein
MTGRKEEAYFEQAERLYCQENKTIAAIAALLPVSVNILYQWRLKGGWKAKRRAIQEAPRGIASRMRSTLEQYLAQIEADAGGGKLEPATFDAINKAVAAIRQVERQAVDLQVMAVEVMRAFVDWLKAQKMPQGELLLFGERIRAWFRDLE